MDVIDWINVAIAFVTIAFGAIGWLAPGYTMKTVDLKDGGSSMGQSEVRAASGALFVMAGLGALLISTPGAYAMVGFIWAGGALGRVTSLVVDGRTRKKWIFFGTEIVVAAVALWLNLPLI